MQTLLWMVIAWKVIGIKFAKLLRGKLPYNLFYYRKLICNKKFSINLLVLLDKKTKSYKYKEAHLHDVWIHYNGKLNPKFISKAPKYIFNKKTKKFNFIYDPNS